MYRRDTTSDWDNYAPLDLTRLLTRLLDLRSKPRIIGLDGAFDYGRRLPRPVEEVHVKVPPQRLAGPLAGSQREPSAHKLLLPTTIT